MRNKAQTGLRWCQNIAFNYRSSVSILFSFWVLVWNFLLPFSPPPLHVVLWRSRVDLQRNRLPLRPTFISFRSCSASSDVAAFTSVKTVLDVQQNLRLKSVHRGDHRVLTDVQKHILPVEGTLIHSSECSIRGCRLFG